MKKVLLISISLVLLLLASSCAAETGIAPAQYAQATADLAAAQEKIASQQTALDKANAQVTKLQADLDKANAQIKSDNTTIDAIQSQMKTLQATVDAAQSQVKTIQTNLDTANSQIKVLQGDTTQTYQIRALQSQVAAANDTLAQVKLKITLVNDIWFTVSFGRNFDTTVLDSYRSLVQSIGDGGVTLRFNTLYNKLDNASAIDLLTYLLDSIASAVS